jgi:hypothetical protein
MKNHELQEMLSLEDCMNGHALRALYFHLINYSNLDHLLQSRTKATSRRFVQLLLEFIHSYELDNRSIGRTINLERYCKENYERVIRLYHNALEQQYNPYTDDVRGNLLQQAPSKLIDGFWLARVAKIDRNQLSKNLHSVKEDTIDRAVDTLYEIYDEEDGEGDIEKNHVHIYEKLLQQAKIELPPNTSREFAFDGRIKDDAFFSPCLQLSMALLQDELFPEICGFTLNFEEMPLSLLLMRDALKQHDLNDYYYLLHITIDNPCSGHCFKARQILELFMEPYSVAPGVFSTDNDIWKRLYSGYILASFMTPDAIRTRLCGNAPGSNPAKETQRATSVMYVSEKSPRQQSDLLSKMADIIEKYAPYAACPIHRSVKVKGKTMSDALTLMSAEQFVDELASSGWVKPGYPDQSLLVRSFGFGQKMFKVFSDEDQEIIRQWIGSLPKKTRDCRRQVGFMPSITIGSPNCGYFYMVLFTMLLLVAMTVAVNAVAL